MKITAIRIGFFLLFSIIVANTSIGQNLLIGHWTAYCALETTDKNVIQFCEICPIQMSEEDTKIRFKEFNLIFEDELLSVIINDIKNKTSYTFNDDTDILSFAHDSKEYSFNVLVIMASPLPKLLLKEEDGTILFLEQAE